MADGEVNVASFFLLGKYIFGQQGKDMGDSEAEKFLYLLILEHGGYFYLLKYNSTLFHLQTPTIVGIVEIARLR